MGLSFKKLFKKVSNLNPFGAAYNGISHYAGPNGNDPGPGYNTPANPNALRWDPYTFRPIGLGGPPDHRFAINYQYKADELADQRRAALMQDARGTYDQSMEMFQRYRPGGAASLASGMYANKANLLMGQASMIEAPDMMARARADAQMQANKEAKRARNIGIVTSLLNSGASLLGMGAGGGAGAAGAAGAILSGSGPGPWAGGYQMPQEGGQQAFSAGSQGPGPWADGYQFGPGGGAQAQMEAPGGPQAGPSMNATMQPGGGVQSTGGGAAGPGAPMPTGTATGGGGPTARRGAPGSGAGGAGGGQQGPGAGAGGPQSGMLGMGGGGYGTNGDFSPSALAMSASAQPGFQQMMLRIYAEESSGTTAAVWLDSSERILEVAYADWMRA